MQFGLVFSQFFLLVTAKITHLPGIYLYIPTNAFILTMIVFLGLFIVVSSFTPMLIRTKKTVNLLKLMVGNKRKENHPYLSLFGAICLLGGYILAGNPKYFFSINSQVGVIYMVSSIFVIPTLVTIGTYFSFLKLVSYLFIF